MGDALREQPPSVFPKKKCRTCRRIFVQVRPLQACCSTNCAIQYAKFAGEKRLSVAQKRAHQAEKREWQEANKKLSKFVKEAQAQFNKFIRLRDDGKPCICCGRFPTKQDAGLRGHLWDAGHYRSTGAAAHLRFNEDNCHRQMATCNRDRSGNAGNYRLNLIERIGSARVEALENDNRTVKWTRDELVAIRKQYASKWRALKAARE